MSKQLRPFSIVAPGSLGLNKKSQSLEIGPQWCTNLRNGVITPEGTLGSRNGWSTVNDTEISGAPDVKAIHEYIDSNGDLRIISAAGNKIYEGTNTLTEVTGTITTPTDDHWKFVNFNGKVVGVQEGHEPIVKSGSGDFDDIDFAGGGGDVDKPVEALAAWGRVWYAEADRQTIRWSDLLDEATVDDSSSPGSSGTLNLYTVWANGVDEVQALAEFNNFLVIFGKKQVILYSGGEDPNNNLAISDIITGVGCVARDSVQNVGNDILFLADSGVISLARNIESGSLPLSNIADNVSDFLSIFVQSESAEAVKSAYKEDDRFYIVSFPASDRVFYFDLRYPTPDDKARVALWDTISPTALHVTRGSKLYIGKAGYIGEYTGYRDNGSSYDFEFTTGWTSGGEQSSLFNKIWKQSITTVRGGADQTITFSWGFDFSGTSADTSQADVEFDTDPAEYGIAEYNIAEYSATAGVDTLNFRMSGTGKVIQFTYRTTIDGSEVQLQKTDLFAKVGRLV